MVNRPESKTEAPKRIKKRYASGEQTRIMADWALTDLDADGMILRDAGKTRARCRSLRRDNPYFRRFLAELSANVIGADGIRLKMKVKRANRGRGANRPDDRLNRMIEDAWHEFSKCHNWDAARQLGRAEWSRVAIQTIATTGELPIRLLRGFEKNAFGFAVQGLEPDHLPFTFDREAAQDRSKIRGCVETDSYGEPIAYHVLKQHPGRETTFFTNHNDSEKIRIQSESWRTLSGDRASDSMILAFAREEWGQTRGMSWASTALRMLRQLGAYEEAAVVGARIASSKMFFIEPSELTAQYGQEEEEEALNGSSFMDAQPGSGHKLLPGEKISSWNPQDPNGNYESFRRGILRGICGGLLCSYNIVANDLESTSYSSLRQAILSERELWKTIQSWWIQTVEEPLFRAWLEMAIVSGQLPVSADEYDRICCPHFEGRRWDWIDPAKDIRAAREEVELGTDSLQGIARKRGRDLMTIAEEMREDAAIAEGENDQLELGFSESFLPDNDPPAVVAQTETTTLN